MTESAYRIGQVLYVIPRDKPLVVPICILEKRTSETLEGIATRYIVKGPKPDAKSYDLSTVEGQIYTSLDEVRRVMMENSRRAIDDMVTKAEKAAQKAFGVRQQLPAPRPQETDPMDLDGIDVDGNLDDEDEMEPVHQVHQPPMNVSRNGSVPATVEVRGPDGKLQRVHIKP